MCVWLHSMQQLSFWPGPQDGRGSLQSEKKIQKMSPFLSFQSCLQEKHCSCSKGDFFSANSPINTSFTGSCYRDGTAAPSSLSMIASLSASSWEDFPCTNNTEEDTAAREGSSGSAVPVGGSRKAQLHVLSLPLSDRFFQPFPAISPTLAVVQPCLFSQPQAKSSTPAVSQPLNLHTEPSPMQPFSFLALMQAWHSPLTCLPQPMATGYSTW